MACTCAPPRHDCNRLPCTHSTRQTNQRPSPACPPRACASISPSPPSLPSLHVPHASPVHQSSLDLPAARNCEAATTPAPPNAPPRRPPATRLTTIHRQGPSQPAPPAPAPHPTCPLCAAVPSSSRRRPPQARPPPQLLLTPRLSSHPSPAARQRLGCLDRRSRPCMSSEILPPDVNVDRGHHCPTAIGQPRCVVLQWCPRSKGRAGRVPAAWLLTTPQVARAWCTLPPPGAPFERSDS